MRRSLVHTFLCCLFGCLFLVIATSLSVHRIEHSWDPIGKSDKACEQCDAYQALQSSSIAAVHVLLLPIVSIVTERLELSSQISGLTIPGHFSSRAPPL